MEELRTAGWLLELMKQPGVGAGTAIALAERFGAFESLIAASPSERRAAAGSRGASIVLSELNPRRASEPAPGVLGYFDASFPERLRSIPSPPAVLWVHGELPESSAASVAVVGTREPTAWGERTAERSVVAVAQHHATIVSGLALGIDGIAHRQALASGLPTIAVLGSGLDRPTPREHAGLAEQIVASGGALISEVPPGTQPSARTLVARNRLQSGLSDAVVVAQCGTKSGTLHTARFALLQRRPLIVPYPTGTYATEEQSAGNLALITSSDPAVVQARGADARRLSSRASLADSSPRDADELVEALTQALGGVSRRGDAVANDGQLQLGVDDD